MSAKRSGVVLVALALLSAACGGTGAGDESTTTIGPGAPTTTMEPIEGTVTFAPDATEARLEIDRTDAPQASPSDLAGLVAGDTAFAFDLFADTAGVENLMISPYSIVSALTMTYAGADGDTRREMAEVLHIADEQIVHAARALLDLSLGASAAPPFREEEPPPFNLAVANSIWGQRDYPFVEEFLATIALNYGAGIRLVDYSVDAEAARVEINDWVEDQTNDRIIDLIPPGALNEFTRLTLVNAIWFKANWLDQFDPEVTRDAPFTRLDGSVVSTPTMHGEIQGGYATGSGYQAVRIPYWGDASITIVLPDAGTFSEMVGELSPELLQVIRGDLSYASVIVDLPKFEFRTALGLKETLTRLGMPTAFAPPPAGADFSRMSPVPELFIGDVLHQAFVVLDEEGTEAAAATAVIVRPTSSGPPPVELTIDRPFMFLITHDPSGEILFIGQVTDPTA